MPIKRTDEPRCAVEYLISKLYSSALFDRIGIRGLQFAGVEWWIQDVSGEEEPKTFHTDCDFTHRSRQEWRFKKYKKESKHRERAIFDERRWSHSCIWSKKEI